MECCSVLLVQGESSLEWMVLVHELEGGVRVDVMTGVGL